jgi:hypothetical protein
VTAGGQTMPADTPLEELTPFVPNNGAEIQGDVFMVNGILSDVALQAADLQAYANKGYRVVGIHNATRGMARDLAQCLGDKLDLSLANNKAVNTARRVTQEVLAKQLAVTLCGHSQGALVLSRAIAEVGEEMSQAGVAKTEVREKLAPLKVETLGGASATFPAGPQYTHRYNTLDLVPMLTGRPLFSLVKRYPGESFHKFSKLRSPEELPPWKNGVVNRLARLVDATTHGARDIYIDRISLPTCGPA